MDKLIDYKKTIIRLQRSDCNQKYFEERIEEIFKNLKVKDEIQKDFDGDEMIKFKDELMIL